MKDKANFTPPHFLSLNQTASDSRTINGSAKVEGEARAALMDVGVEGLIAQPAH